MHTAAIVIAIILYLGGMIAIGIRAGMQNKTTDDFYLGGRRLGPWVTAMSAEASDMSAYLLMGIPGVALMCGIPEAFWTALGLAVGTYVNWLFVAKRLRIYSEKLDAITVPQFFSKRFGDEKHFLSIVAAIIIIIFFVPYTASGFSACGKLFHNLFGMNYMTAMVISAAVIVVYCTMGGFLAASRTDLVQSIVMTIALIVVLGISEGLLGGFENLFATLRSMDGYTVLTKGFDVATSTTASYGAFSIITTLAWGLGYFGMPHILLRFMAIENPRELKFSRRIATVWVVISMAVAILIGFAGVGLMKAGIVGPYANASDAETIIVDISRFIGTKGYIPAFAGGIFLSGILAATMSTADSQLIAASSSVTQDLLVDTFKLKITEKKNMLIARISVIIIAIIAVLLARNPDASVFRIVSFAWAGFGASFGPVMLVGLFWKRMNKAGALAGMISGGAMVFIWKFGIAKLGGVFAVYELLPAFIVSCIFILIFSLIFKAPDEQVQKDFERVKNLMKQGS